MNADTAVCKSDCTRQTCGDGFVGPGEGCDDGNDVDDDGCTNDCRLATCGDGVVQPGEPCDDGNDVDDDTCTNNCTLPACGDGIVQPGEACDDGNASNADACVAGCKAATCGDGFLWDGVEACDDGNTNDNDSCTKECALASCGDGIVQPGEDCDLGGANADDGACTTKCLDAQCGDGLVWDGKEACDDGNDVPDDDCTNDCTLPVCGDGVVQPQLGEQCDLEDAGNLDPATPCTVDCLDMPTGVVLGTMPDDVDVAWRFLGTIPPFSTADEPTPPPDRRPVRGFATLTWDDQSIWDALIRVQWTAAPFVVMKVGGRPAIVAGQDATDGFSLHAPFGNGFAPVTIPAALRLCPSDTWLVGMGGKENNALTTVQLTCVGLEVVLQNGAYTITHGTPVALDWGGSNSGDEVLPIPPCPDGWVAGMTRTGWTQNGVVQLGLKCVRVRLTY